MGTSAITGINLGVPAHQRNFVFPDLSSGVLTVTHNLNSQYVSVTVFDENNLLIIPDDVDAISTTQLTIDLTSFGSFAGAMRAIIVNTGANVNNIATDLNIAGQAEEDYLIRGAASWGAKGGVELRKVDTFTRDTSLATGTQSVVGVGFKPSYVIFLAVQNANDEASWGFDDGTDNRGIADNNGIATDTYVVGGAIELRESPGNIYAGSISTFDADGFTMSWIRAGTPTGTATIRFTAFR